MSAAICISQRERDLGKIIMAKEHLRFTIEERPPTSSPLLSAAQTRAIDLSKYAHSPRITICGECN